MCKEAENLRPSGGDIERQKSILKRLQLPQTLTQNNTGEFNIKLN